MARTLYTLLWWIALPLLPLRLWWRGRKEPGYRRFVGERFGCYSSALPRPTNSFVWIHAVSLGETRAVAPLIERIARERPDLSLLLTHMTATGRDAGRALFGDRVAQVWLPYDIPFAVRAFIRRFAPSAGVLVETELWPNLAAECKREDIGLFLVNARLSARSAAGYARISPLSRPMLDSLAGVAAQTAADAKRFTALGARDVTIAGNLKFDLAIPESARALGREFRERFGEARPVWVAGSTRDGEETLIFDALARADVSELPKGTLMIIVPRHPQRFEAVAALLRSRSVPFVRRSENTPVLDETRVVLGDSLGELLAYYAAADVAFVGGSLLSLGGQNLIEPIALGIPTLIGPHTFNFAEATVQAIDAGAAVRVADASALIAEVGGLLRDQAKRGEMRAAANAFCAAHRGAADRLWTWLAPKLPMPTSAR
ncbi:MAG TPA: lipid IV(A) 3-deoxy-D-manno-octulosonic acid transferase [Casimicrobiaceae bacterium]